METKPKENIRDNIIDEMKFGNRAGRITAEDAINGLLLELLFDVAFFYTDNNRIPGIMELLSTKLDRYQNNLFQQLFNDLFLPRIAHQMDDIAINTISKIQKSGIVSKIISKLGYDDKITEYRKRFRYHRLVPLVQPELVAEYGDVSFPEKKLIFRKRPQKTVPKKISHNKRNLIVNK